MGLGSAPLRPNYPPASGRHTRHGPGASGASLWVPRDPLLLWSIFLWAWVLPPAGRKLRPLLGGTPGMAPSNLMLALFFRVYSFGLGFCPPLAEGSAHFWAAHPAWPLSNLMLAFFRSLFLWAWAELPAGPMLRPLLGGTPGMAPFQILWPRKVARDRARDGEFRRVRRCFLWDFRRLRKNVGSHDARPRDGAVGQWPRLACVPEAYNKQPLRRAGEMATSRLRAKECASVYSNRCRSPHRMIIERVLKICHFLRAAPCELFHSLACCALRIERGSSVIQPLFENNIARLNGMLALLQHAAAAERRGRILGPSARSCNGESCLKAFGRRYLPKDR